MGVLASARGPERRLSHGNTLRSTGETASWRASSFLDGEAAPRCANDRNADGGRDVRCFQACVMAAARVAAARRADERDRTGSKLYEPPIARL
jgi:hypothetical protein